MTAGMLIQPLGRKLMVAWKRSRTNGPRYHLHVNASTRSRILLRGPDDLQVSATRPVRTFCIVDMERSLILTSTRASRRTTSIERRLALGCPARDQHGPDQLAYRVDARTAGGKEAT